jgi:hypothetical protein
MIGHGYPRHAKGISRGRCAPCFLRKAIYFLKGFRPMMFELLLDVTDCLLNLRDTNAECAMALLLGKV